MNKTVTANISGFIFHIEEEAYQKLNNYLNAIRNYLKNNSTRNEIISDIEARIAELFQQRIKNNKEVIIDADVTEIIEILGAPEVFIEEENETKTGNKNENTTEAEDNGNRVRRVFRNSDDKVLGGVCSGFGAYFNIDPLWIRLGLVASFFAFGFGFLLYLVLWIIIPEAKTAAEKLEMKGEKVNLKNIEKTIREEYEDLKTRYNNPGSKDKVKNGISTFFGVIGNLIQYFFLALSKIIGAVLTIFGILLLIGLISSILGINDSIHMVTLGTSTDYTLSEFFNTLFENRSQQILATIGVFILVAVPLVMMIYAGIRIILKQKVKNRIVSTVSGIVWTIGLLICIYVGYNLALNFKETATNKEYFTMSRSNQIVLKTSYISDALLESKDIDEDEKMLTSEARKIFHFASLTIEKSDSNKVEIDVIRIAKGSNRKDASQRAKSIGYTFTQKDSILLFDPHFDINSSEKWRVQNVKIRVKIPVGQEIFLEKGMEQLLYDVDNIQNTWDADMANRRWKMTERGLTCIDCDHLEIIGR